MHNDIMIMAKTIYGEARGEYNQPNGGLAALIAVGNVVLNRVKSPKNCYGQDVASVCQKPYQFSCWNKQDHNYSIIANVNAHTDKIFAICLEVADNLINHNWPDIVKDATHYYANHTIDQPEWALNNKYVFTIGNHKFYKL